VSWVPISALQGPAVCLPKAVAVCFLRWVDETRAKGVDDQLLTRFCRATGLKRWATRPSLVEHGRPLDSLIKGRTRRILEELQRKDPTRRVASLFIGEDVSALSIDWRAGL